MTKSVEIVNTSNWDNELLTLYMDGDGVPRPSIDLKTGEKYKVSVNDNGVYVEIAETPHDVPTRVTKPLFNKENGEQVYPTTIVVWKEFKTNELVDERNVVTRDEIE